MSKSNAPYTPEDAAERERIEAIRKRVDLATAGPWTLFARGTTVEVDYDSHTDAPVVKWTGFDASYLSQNADRANADFIAHAREDVPFLLDALEKAGRAITRLQAIEQRAQEAMLSGNKVGRYILEGSPND